MNLQIYWYIRTLTFYWSEYIHIPIFGYSYSNIRYLAKNIQIFEYIWLFAKLWYIFMNEYHSVFHIQKFHEQILFGFRYSKFFLWINTIRYLVFGKFSWTNTIRYSVFGNVSWTKYYSVFEHFSWTNTVRYSVFGNSSWTNIYSVFGIRSNSLFGATLVPRGIFD